MVDLDVGYLDTVSWYLPVKASQYMLEKKNKIKQSLATKIFASESSFLAFPYKIYKM